MTRCVAGKNDLETWCKDNDQMKYLEEWNADKNVGISPGMIAKSSRKEVWWRCDKGHEWMAPVNARTGNKYGCPYCSGRRVLVGYNDFATNYPDISKEWHPTKNDGIAPTDFTSRSKQRVWWQCEKGHEWQATICDRTLSNSGCPICAKELKTSFPEQALFYYIKCYFTDAISADTSFGVELDIFIPSKNTAIEYDGYHWHKNKFNKDLNKNKKCAESNITMLRVRESGLPHIELCTEFEIGRKHSDSELSEVIKSVLACLGIESPQVNIAADRVEILSSYVQVRKSNSLLVKYPDIAKEWHPTKNKNLSPELISFGSEIRVWWIADCGHEWIATPNYRVYSGSGCPYCSGRKILKGFNDLKTCNPRLSLEWNFEKNAPLLPDEVTVNSSKRVWWKCEKGHEWQSVISDRTRGNGCPYCSNHKVKQGLNDLETLYPHIAKEWHPTKNGELKPADVLYGSMRKVWWQCEKGHEWETTVTHRTSRGQGCPYCSNRKVSLTAYRTVLTNGNDLKSCNPTLAAEWNYERNGTLQPEFVTSKSVKKVWWKCNKGHEWEAMIVSRANGTGCPYCSNRKLLKGFNDLNTVYPTIAKEWHPTRNGSLLPSDVMYGSQHKVWWQCVKNHEWQATVINRTSRGQGCPYCSGRLHPPTQCIETGVVYEHGMDAEKDTGITTSSINQCCKGMRKTAGGYHWKYVD